MKLKPETFKCILMVIFFMLLALWGIITFYAPRLPDYPASTYICDKDGNPIRTILGDGDVRCKPIVLSQAGEWATKALIAAEDKRFYRHSGIDLIAAMRAVGQNIIWHRVVSGASTLSTQVIRMSTPRQRTVMTKILEAVSALQMERRFSKDDILTQYLNRMPLGGNLVGIQAASRKYFGKDAADLSLAEASLLAGLPQAPSRFRPDRRLKRALKRRKFVLQRMQNLGFITAKEKQQAEEQIMEIKMQPDPFFAPHFCELVKQSFITNKNIIRKKSEIRTTLNRELQDIAVATLKEHNRKLQGKSIFGGAVVIIEVATGNVVALVGSPDYDDNAHAGKVNCAIMPRSPGSTLKPFAYAMALDRGLITPGKVIADVPLYFKDYTPQNFDYEFRGLVTARQALVDSLNIPALSIVKDVGLNEFVTELRRVGLASLNQSAMHYGLSVVLGTGEVKLLNLVNAYACLARQGEYMPYKLLAGENNFKKEQIFSAGAAWMIADMLSGNERSMAIVGHAADVTMPRIAWKTGTSSGGRDAWTVGYNPEYAIGVWLGNPDGSGLDGLVGIEDAAPVVMEIFRQIYPDGRSPWYRKPDLVSVRKVCADSGCPVSRCCESSVDDYYMPGISDPAQCRVHTVGSDDKIRERYPAAISSFFDKMSGNCGENVRIVKPQNGESFVISDDLLPAVQKIELKAVAEGTLCWFVDGRLIATTDNPVSWQLRKGMHEIVCTDLSGVADSVNITVD